MGCLTECQEEHFTLVYEPCVMERRMHFLPISSNKPGCDPKSHAPATQSPDQMRTARAPKGTRAQCAEGHPCQVPIQRTSSDTLKIFDPVKEGANSTPESTIVGLRADSPSRLEQHIVLLMILIPRYRSLAYKCSSTPPDASHLMSRSFSVSDLQELGTNPTQPY